MMIAHVILAASMTTAPALTPQQKGRLEEQQHSYVEIIVEACPQVIVPLEPTDQGKSFDDEPPYTEATHDAELKALHCIDVPIPPQAFVGNTGMTIQACEGHAGYLAAMQFLEERQDLQKFPTVGGWHCVMMPARPSSITNM